MNQKNEQKIIVVLKVLSVILIILCIILVIFSITNKSNNNNNNKTTTISKEENNEQECNEDYSAKDNDNYIYKVKVTNKNGAKVYDGYDKRYQKVINTINEGEEVAVLRDIVDDLNYSLNSKKMTYNKFEEIKDYYYFMIDDCEKGRYIKYEDVSIINSSINISKNYDKTLRFYVSKDEEIYNGPGLSFDVNNIKIPKGTIVNVNTYSGGSNDNWLLVEDEEYKGWILNTIDTNNNLKRGSATKIDESPGQLSLNKKIELYKYAFPNSNDKPILTIPAGTIVKYDYFTKKSRIIYYHINYNGNEGWINLMN